MTPKVRPRWDVSSDFGNLTSRNGTGTAQGTTISTPVNATTNQLSGYTYDANGNLISTGYTYDVENRLSFANSGAVQYFYDAQNKRVWQATCLTGYCTPGGTWILYTSQVNLFGPDGKQLSSYSPQPAWNNTTYNQVAITFAPVALRSYFGGRLVAQQSGGNTYQAVIQDRLGSVGKYYPYGEERNSPQLPNDQVKFATYTRDSATGNDYADQRYYTSVLGRFMTPDPSGAAQRSTNPQSWNKFAYVTGDPINFMDQKGLDEQDVLDCLAEGASDASLSCGDYDLQDFLEHPEPSRTLTLSVYRVRIDALAAALLAANIARMSESVRIPSYLQVKSECWAPAAPQAGSLTYTLEVTYQILDQYGVPLSGSALSGVSIAEGFYAQTGNLDLKPAVWLYGTASGIQSDGTFTDYLSAGGVPGLSTLSGFAFQTFRAGGTVGGVPFFQPLEIMGFGATTSILTNSYNPTNVSINYSSLGHDPSKECPPE